MILSTLTGLGDITAILGIIDEKRVSSILFSLIELSRGVLNIGRTWHNMASDMDVTDMSKLQKNS